MRPWLEYEIFGNKIHFLEIIIGIHNCLQVIAVNEMNR